MSMRTYTPSGPVLLFHALQVDGIVSRVQTHIGVVQLPNDDTQLQMPTYSI